MKRKKTIPKNQDDRTITIPEALRKYFDQEELLDTAQRLLDELDDNSNSGLLRAMMIGYYLAARAMGGMMKMAEHSDAEYRLITREIIAVAFDQQVELVTMCVGALDSEIPQELVDSMSSAESATIH